MMTTTFQIDSWKEKSYFESEDGSKLSKATVKKSYRGTIDGLGIVDYLMSYYPDGSAYFVGIERVVGKVFGKAGTFIFSHEGTFNDGITSSEFRILEASTTQALKGLVGNGSFSTEHATTVPIEFSFEFEN